MSPSPHEDGFEIPSWLHQHLVLADNPQPHCDLLAGQVCKDNLSIADWDRAGNSLMPRSITCRDPTDTQRNPKMSHPQLSERVDAAVGVIQVFLAGDT